MYLFSFRANACAFALLLVHLTAARDASWHHDLKSGSAEEAVKRSTRARAELYFGGRETVGLPVRYPFLCYMLMTKKKELPLLMQNIAAFGDHCDWVITANIANDLVVDTDQLSTFAGNHSAKIVQIDLNTASGYLVKTILWRDVIHKYRDMYSHVWFIDADILFGDKKRILAIENEWLCGSVAGNPPLVSQPSIKAEGEKQAYSQVNYYSVYHSSAVSTIGTDVVENQVLLADMNFMFWLYEEIIDPYFSRYKEYNITAWGISRTWCHAGSSYIGLAADYHLAIGRKIDRPRSCGVMPTYVHHESTHGINKTDAFYLTGRVMASKLHSAFPNWNTRYKKLSGYPNRLLDLVDEIHGNATDSGKVLHRGKKNSSLCKNQRTHFGRKGSMWAYAWV